jgi:hypothetical protein
MGKSRKPFLWIALALLVVGGIRISIALNEGSDDKKLIRDALAEAIKASKEGRPGGVVELFSRNLKVNNQEVNSNQGQIADFIRNQKPDVTVSNPSPLITGDEARIVSPVELDMGLLGKRNMDNVTMIFKREDSTAYLIFPTHVWRLVEVRAPESAISDLMSG